MMVGRERANAVVHIPMTTVKLPKKATLRNENFFIMGPLIKPRLQHIVPFK